MLIDIKMYFYAGMAIVIGIFTILFKQRGAKIEEQEKEIEGKTAELEVQEKISEDKIKQSTMVYEIKKSELNIEKENTSSKLSDRDKVINTEDSIEYEVKI